MTPNGDQVSESRGTVGYAPYSAAFSFFAISLALVLLIGFLASPADAQRRVEIYKVQFRIAEELLPLAEIAMGSAAGVTLDRGTNTLVLMGDAETVAATVALLASQDRALRTVVIRYESMTTRELLARGYEIRWHAATGNSRIGNVRVRSSADASVDVRTKAELRKLTDSFRSTMRVTEGARTRIETGTIVPFGVSGPSGTTTEYVDASTGFEADARILGDGRVRIDLESFAAEPVGEAGSIASTLASTQVVVEPGDTIVVANSDRSNDEVRRQRLGSKQSATRREEAVWVLHVEVE